MCLAAVDTFFAYPINIYLFVRMCISVRGYDYISWDYVHANYSTIYEIPYSLWSADPNNCLSVVLNQWVYVFGALLFFIFFGTTKELLERVAMMRKRTQAITKSRLSTIAFGAGHPSRRARSRCELFLCLFPNTCTKHWYLHVRATTDVTLASDFDGESTGGSNIIPKVGSGTSMPDCNDLEKGIHEM